MRDRWMIASNAALIGSVMLFASLNGAANGEAVVIAPKWLGFPGAFAVIARADGAIVNADRFETVAVGYSEDKAFVARLYKEGALLAFNAPNPAGCASRP
jgi:hypothetical protein